jgi:UDPglucose 6-dehydrogenase
LNRGFLNAGAGFGGSCFPKDVKAIVNEGVNLGEGMSLLKSVLKINEEQPLKMIELLLKHLNPENKTIGVLGLAFKPGTDDIREAPSLIIIDKLLELNADVLVYDPKAINNVKKIYNHKIGYAKSALDLVNKSKAVLIVTDWDEFKKPEMYKGKIVIDGRRVRTKAKTYEGICW